MIIFYQKQTTINSNTEKEFKPQNYVAIRKKWRTITPKGDRKIKNKVQQKKKKK
jgi:hypothetical protein